MFLPRLCSGEEGRQWEVPGGTDFGEEERTGEETTGCQWPAQLCQEATENQG